MLDINDASELFGRVFSNDLRSTPNAIEVLASSWFWRKPVVKIIQCCFLIKFFVME